MERFFFLALYAVHREENRKIRLIILLIIIDHVLELKDKSGRLLCWMNFCKMNISNFNYSEKLTWEINPFLKISHVKIFCNELLVRSNTWINSCSTFSRFTTRSSFARVETKRNVPVHLSWYLLWVLYIGGMGSRWIPVSAELRTR